MVSMSCNCFNRYSACNYFVLTMSSNYFVAQWLQCLATISLSHKHFLLVTMS